MPTTFNTDKDKFVVKIDVQQFSPDEITVRTSKGYLIVEARHEEKEDGLGYVEREFVRKYELPRGAMPDHVYSEVSSDGVLTVTTPRQVEMTMINDKVLKDAFSDPLPQKPEETAAKKTDSKHDYGESCKDSAAT